MPAEPVDTLKNSTPSSLTTKRRSSWLTLRVILLAVLLAPVCTYWSCDQVVDRIFSLMIPPVILTLVIVLANKVLLRFAPRAALTEGELVVFYAMQTLICAMSGEWLATINPYIAGYALAAKNDAGIRNHVMPYISSWLYIKNPKRLKAFNDGGYPLSYTLTHLGIWWRPVLAWTALVTLVCFAMLCINTLMREEWTQRERLAFPIIQLPMALTAGGGASPFWRNKYVWGGFLVMAAIDLLDGFHFLYPSLPWVNVRFLGDVSLWFPSPPWNAIGWTPIGFFPFIAGIGVFMPTDLLFSCVFFFFVRKAEQVVVASFGNPQGVFGGSGLVPGPPYLSEQSWGAFLGLFVSAIWVSRGYLSELWRDIKSGAKKPSDISPRIAFIGLVVSVALLGWFGVGLGISWWLVVVYISLFLVFSIALTRLRAQLGAPSHEMAFMGPNQMLVDFVGTQGVPEASISRVVTTFYFMNRIHRTDPMPSQLEAMKMGETGGVSPIWMFGALLLATVIGSILGHLTLIYFGYYKGAAYSRQLGQLVGTSDTAGVISDLVNNRRPPNPTAITAVMAGFLFVLSLDFIRFRFPGFPFHPAGYALAMNFGVDYYWFGLLVVLIIKMFVTRYYGLPGYEKLRSIAMGVILAEFVVETLWTSMAMITHHATFSVSINGRLGWNL